MMKKERKKTTFKCSLINFNNCIKHTKGEIKLYVIHLLSKLLKPYTKKIIHEKTKTKPKVNFEKKS